MEKLNKDLNPVNKFLADNPENSRIDTLILKFRDEISKKTNTSNEFITRKLTTVHPVANSSSQRIDEQITDLENLIKKIQNEIVQLSNTNLKPVEEDTNQETQQEEIKKNETHVEPTEEHVVNKTTMEDVDGDIAPVYPIILRDVEMKLNDNEDLSNPDPSLVGLKIRETDDLNNQISNLVGLNLTETEDLDSQVLNLGVLKLSEEDLDKQISNLVHKEILSKAPENVTDIRETFSVLWNDEPDPVTATRHGKSVEQLISELKAEINEKLESLHDVDIGQPLNNSDEEC